MTEQTLHLITKLPGYAAAPKMLWLARDAFSHDFTPIVFRSDQPNIFSGMVVKVSLLKSAELQKPLFQNLSSEIAITQAPLAKIIRVVGSRQTFYIAGGSEPGEGIHRYHALPLDKHNAIAAEPVILLVPGAKVKDIEVKSGKFAICGGVEMTNGAHIVHGAFLPNRDKPCFKKAKQPDFEMDHLSAQSRATVQQITSQYLFTAFYESAPADMRAKFLFMALHHAAHDKRAFSCVYDRIEADLLDPKESDKNFAALLRDTFNVINRNGVQASCKAFGLAVDQEVLSLFRSNAIVKKELDYGRVVMTGIIKGVRNSLQACGVTPLTL